MPSFTKRALGYALGAEITGIDLAADLDPGTVRDLRQAWLDHILLCFPGQDLDAEGLTRFSSHFGELDDNRLTPHLRYPGHPEVLVIVNKPTTFAGLKLAGGVGNKWHTDLSYTDRPATASFLLAKEIPDVGGDTMFANQYLAYETLSEGMKHLIAALEGVHDVALGPTFYRDTPEVQAERRRLNPLMVHPVVRLHPQSGRRALYLGDRVRQFVGMTPEESRPLIAFLNAHAVGYELFYRHRWRVNDLVMWDNRCALHYAIPDYDRTQLRRMIRTSLLAPKSGRYYEERSEPVAAAM